MRNLGIFCYKMRGFLAVLVAGSLVNKQGGVHFPHFGIIQNPRLTQKAPVAYSRSIAAKNSGRDYHPEIFKMHGRILGGFFCAQKKLHCATMSDCAGESSDSPRSLESGCGNPVRSVTSLITTGKVTVSRLFKESVMTKPAALSAMGQDQSTLLTVDQVATYLKIQPATLANWRCSTPEKLPFIKIGNRVRYKQSDVDIFVQQNRRMVGGVA